MESEAGQEIRNRAKEKVSDVLEIESGLVERRV